jgi:hypothetical protein
MFKHKQKNEPLIEENDMIELTSDFNEDEQEYFDDDKETDEIDEHDDSANKMFINPTQVDISECDPKIKCEICDFRARSKDEVNNHKTTTHNWCSFCVSQERLKKHFKNKHNKQ